MPADISALFEAQHEASRADQFVALATRRDRIDRAIAMMQQHCERLCEAMSEDFGNRSKAQSIAIDIAATIESLKFARRKLAYWMRPERRSAAFPMGLLGAGLEVHHRPLGVVCIIGAWNFPVGTVTVPLAGALAAGNRAILKPSEMTPKTSEALRQAVAEFFAADELAVVEGGAETGRLLSSLAFDRIVFTGGSATARHIMRSAAEHLVPLTLELGGKSPVIVGRGASLDHAARQIMFGKLFNAGQVCVGPDYALVPQGHAAALEQRLVAAAERMLPTLLENPDYSSIATRAHQARLHEMLDDARRKGAREVVINPAREALDPAGGRKIAPRLLFDVTDAMSIMQQEIFGPILPVLSYERIEQAIAYVNARPRPLSLYYFGQDREEEKLVLSRTVSGGVTVNDVLMHAAQEDAPFGGVGASGFGCYRGHDGFREFSTPQTVLRQSRLNVSGLLRPPYTPAKLWALRSQLRG